MTVPEPTLFKSAKTAHLGDSIPRAEAHVPMMQSDLPITQEVPGLDTGVWEGSPGSFSVRRDGYSETAVILSGRAVIESDDGTTLVLGPGDVLITPDGWSGTWIIRETIRKVYVIIYS